MDETDWIQAAKQGDLDAFNKLVLRYQDQVYNVSVWALGDLVAAEAKTQEAFIHAYHAVRRFKKGSFRAWLLKIVVDLCGREVRTGKRAWILARPLAGRRKTSGYVGDEMFEKQSVWPPGMDELPLTTRLAVCLVDVEHLKVQEAADILGVQPEMLNGHLARGRMQFHARSTSQETAFVSMGLR